MNQYLLNTRLCLLLSFFFFASVNSAEESVMYPCLIEPHMNIKVGTPALGIIESISVKRGDAVASGQIIAQIQSELDGIAVKLAEARYQHLNAQYHRIKTLNDQSLVSVVSLDEVQNEMQLAALEVERRKIVLKQKTIRSPVNGVVVRRMMSVGEYAYEQTPLMEVAQTDTLNVELLLPTSVFPMVSIGMKAKVYLKAPVGGVHTAEVSAVDRVMDAASSSFGVRLRIHNPDLAIPAGLQCQAELLR